MAMSSDTPTSPPPRLRFMHTAPKGITTTTPQPRLGVLGGAFNPVTCAHLALAEQACTQFDLTEVLFVLPERLPHRHPHEASLEDRIAMLRLALASWPCFSLAVCTHGLFVDIARALTPHYPRSTRLFFLLGADAADRILLWNYPDREATLAEMFARFDLVIARRAGELAWSKDPLVERFHSHLHRLEMPPDYQSLSGTTVREALRRGNSIDALVPPGVADYIRSHALYRGN